MKKLALLFVFMISYYINEAQTLRIVPKGGFDYYGISYIAKGDYRPGDFKTSVPELAASIGVDVKYSAKKMTHVLSLQSIALGDGFIFNNIYRKAGIVPSVGGHRSASSSNQALLSYGVERGGRGTSWIQGYYGLQLGLGFNKSKAVFDSTYLPYSYGMELGTSYYEYIIHFKRTGMGAFISLKGGISIYNHKKRQIINIEAFWHQGLLKMVEFDLLYRYGYRDRPQLQKQEQVKFNTRGTVFGVMLGIPIYIQK